MFTLLIIIIALIGVIMTGLILLQAGKGGGLAGIASGGATTQILGARQAPAVLERGTWILSTILLVFCILTNFVTDDGSSQRSILQQSQPTPQQTVPGPEDLPPPLEDLSPEPAPLPDEE